MPADDWQPETTDLLGWRLVVGEDSHGQQKWVYLPPGPARDEWKQTKEAKYWLGLGMVCSAVYQLLRAYT